MSFSCQLACKLLRPQTHSLSYDDPRAISKCHTFFTVSFYQQVLRGADVAVRVVVLDENHIYNVYGESGSQKTVISR